MNITGVNPAQLVNTAGLQREEQTGEDFQAILEAAAEKGDTAQVRKAAIEMESFFINQMFQAMRRTVPEPQGVFERSTAEKIFQEMLDEQTAANLAQSGGIGLADVIYEQLTRRS